MYRPVLAIQPCTLVFNNWLQSVPAIQPCTLASTTGYRGINGGNWIQHKIVVNFIQQLVTGCTDWLPAKQPCTVTSMTGYSMYRPATGFTALYSSLNWLQCTGYTALYTGFNNWVPSVPAGTGYTALYTCFILWVTSLLTGCWLHSPYCSASTQLSKFVGDSNLPVFAGYKNYWLQ